MPQLDVNAFLPIVLCLLVCYCFLFLAIYIFLFLPFVNWTKIKLIWQQKQLISTYLTYVYMKQIGSYHYMQKLLETLQNPSLHTTSVSTKKV